MLSTRHYTAAQVVPYWTRGDVAVEMKPQHKNARKKEAC